MLLPSELDATLGNERARVRAWFDRTYQTRGLSYLRPYAAYPIYLQLLAARPGERLLDVGCGPGQLLAAAVRTGLCAHGADVAPSGLRLARARVPKAALARACVEALPYRSGSFDLVTAIGVLERVIDRGRALDELRRVCRPHARLCLMVRNADSLSWRVRCALGRQDRTSHQDAATLAQWRALFEAHGFAIDAIHPDQWLRQRLRRLWRGHPAFGLEPVARPVLPLRLALEFIFLLRVAGPRATTWRSAAAGERRTASAVAVSPPGACDRTAPLRPLAEGGGASLR